MATLTIADLDNGKRDLQTVDAVANSRDDFTQSRYGESVLTLAGALRRLGYQAPVPYATGLNVATGLFTVERDGVVYAPVASRVPFTTGEWDASQWRVVQNTNDDRRAFLFPTKTEADIAAATLIEGQFVDALDVQERYTVHDGALVFSGDLKKRFVSIVDYPFSAKGTDAPEVLAAKINAALAFVGQSGGTVILPRGLWIVGLEIKVPSNVKFSGDGWESVLKGHASLPANQNVVTNVGNTRIPHAEVDTDITIEDMVVDGNWQERPQNTATENQGACVKLSAVHRFNINRVKAVNGILHCIDVSASQYLDDGSTSSQALGSSMFGQISECEAWNPLKDDGITTHNSGFINISRCISIFDRDAYPSGPGSTQQGIEIDEGSFNVVVENCLSRGFTKGFQVKGHATTRSAENTTFRRCIAEQCGYGFEFSTGGTPGVVSPYARGNKIEDCEVRNLMPGGGLTNLRIVNFIGQICASLDGLRVSNFGNGIIAIDQAPINIIIKNVVFETVSDRSGSATGLIHGYAFAGSVTNVTIENVVSLVAQPIPLVRGTFAQVFKINNIDCAATDPGVPLIFKAPNNTDVFKGLSGRPILLGWDLGNIEGSGEASTIHSLSVEGRQVELVINYGSPEGLVVAPQGSILKTYRNGRLFRKDTGGISSAFTNTGWVEVS